jgi:hypothetical protein
LCAAADALSRGESRPGRWELARTRSPFGALVGRGFPGVLSFMQAGRPVPSGQPPEPCRERFAPLFAG